MLMPVVAIYAQKDSAKGKKYTMRIAGDLNAGATEIDLSRPGEGFVAVGGCDGYLIVENKNNTGLEIGLNYGEKDYEWLNYRYWTMADYISLFLCFRHDSKIFYYGAGFAEEVKVRQDSSTDNIYPAVPLSQMGAQKFVSEPFDVFSGFKFPSLNTALIGYFGVKIKISNHSNLFLQAEFWNDLFPISKFGWFLYTDYNFVNYGLSIGWAYHIN